MSEADPNFGELLKEAFNVRVKVPMLGEVPINWLFLGTAAVATILFPPVGLIAAGLELALLYGLTHNDRFQNYVKGRRIVSAKADTTGVWEAKRDDLLARLDEDSMGRFELLERRAHTARQSHADHLGGEFDEFLEDGLYRLQLIYLRLLSSRSVLDNQIQQMDEDDLRKELNEAEGRLESMAEEPHSRMAKSVGSMVDILKRRLANLDTARKNVAFIESELRRIEHQTELIIEEAALAKDPDDVARRIDAVTSTFDETQEWMKENRDLMKEVGFDLEADTPRVPPHKQGIS